MSSKTLKLTPILREATFLYGNKPVIPQIELPIVQECTYRDIRRRNDRNLTKANPDDEFTAEDLTKVTNTSGIEENPEQPESTHDAAPPQPSYAVSNNQWPTKDRSATMVMHRLTIPTTKLQQCSQVGTSPLGSPSC